jgi:hypothetical protein
MCVNGGFLALENYRDYVCFHDVDYLPMWADYSYTAHPTRLIWWGMNLRPVRPAEDNRWRVTISKEDLGAVFVIFSLIARTMTYMGDKPDCGETCA